MKSNKFAASFSLMALAAAGLAGPRLTETKEAGPALPAEIKQALAEIGNTFKEYRDTNDQRLASLAEKGAVDTLIEGKMATLNTALDAQQKHIDALMLAAKRPEMVLDAKGKPMSADEADHRKGFDGFMRKGLDDGLAELQLKALSVGVAADGGYAVPKVIDNLIYSVARDISAIRSIATVVQTGTTDYRKLVNKGGAGANWQGETGTTANSGTPTLAEIVPTNGWLEARPRVTQQLLDDAIFDVEAWLADEVAIAFAIAEGAAFISGDGVDKPTGFLSGAAPVATDDAARAFGTLQFVASGQAAAVPTTGDPYIDLIYKLKAQHRQGATWVTDRAMLAAMRKLKDGQGNYLWQPSFIAGMPSTFVGYPVIEAEDMPAVAANSFPLAFGNFRNGYLIAERMGTRVLRDPYTAKPYVEFYTTKRVGGKVMDSEAIKLLKISA